MFLFPLLLIQTARPVGIVTVYFGDSKGCSSFRLSPELLVALEPLTTAVHGSAQHQVLEQGAPGHGVYIVRSGMVRLAIAVADSGREIFHRLLGPGCIVGLPAVLCSEPSLFSARCQGDCTLAFIEASAFQQFLRTQPLLCMEVVRLMGQELTEMNERRASFERCRECGCPFVDTCVHEIGQPR